MPTRPFRPTAERLEDRATPATFVVTSLADAGAGSLRAAVSAANTTAGADAITFDSVAFAAPQTITLGGTLLTLTDTTGATTITGPIAGVTISGGNTSGVFQVGIGVTAALGGLAITGGKSATVGGVANDGTLTVTGCTFADNYTDSSGGGIGNGGTLTVTGCTFTNNYADLFGGGIFNAFSATMAVSDSSFSANSARVFGGGLLNDATATVANSTFSGNSAGAFGGGGLANRGTLAIDNCTFFGNSATLQPGGGIRAESPLTLTNSIVAGSTAGGDLTAAGPGAASSGSNNLIGDGSGVGTLFTNSLSGNPLLGPLADNGGPSPTMALRPGSPALDAGLDSTQPPYNLSTDQRGTGFARRVGAAVDIGAFEAGNRQSTVVTNTNDAGPGSLRRAILSAQNDTTNPGPDTVTFDPTAFAGQKAITLGSALPTITDALTIAGPGANRLTVRRDAANPVEFRILTVGGTGDVSVRGLSITGGVAGVAVGGNGGGVLHSGTGTLTLDAVALSGNRAATGGGVASFFGAGPLVITSSTVAGNSANGGAGVYIFSASGGSLSNSTVSGNTATSVGGAVVVYTGGANVPITGSTIAGNTAGTTGGGIVVVGGSATVTSSVVSGNSAPADPQLAGSVADGGNNLIGGDALLAPLGDYGGPTPTRALLPGSPAIDAGTGTGADQRGVGPVGVRDIGAFESRGFALTAAGGDEQAAPAGAAFGQPLRVTVASSFGEPVDGGRVTFAGPGSGAGLASRPVATVAGREASAVVSANGTTGTYSVTASAAGATGVTFTLTNASGVGLGTLSPTSAIVNTSYIGTIAVLGGVGPYTLGAVTGLPAGLTASIDGNTITLTGTPASRGAFTASVTVNDALDQSATATFTLVVAEAPGLVVTTAQDVTDPFDGLTSLREAVNLANANPGPDAITFDPAVFDTPRVITLTARLALTDTATTAVTAPATGVTIAGGDLSGLLAVAPGASAALNGLALANAVNTALAVAPGGVVTIANGLFVGNTGVLGGAIFSVGTVTATNTTFANNTAGGGGAIATINVSDLTLIGCTVAGNAATSGGSGGNGGGIRFGGGGNLTLVNTIVAGNLLTAFGPVPSDVIGTLTPGSANNLIGEGESLDGVRDGENGNRVGTAAAPLDPLLAPLGEYGGPTRTFALLPGSPALDAGTGSAADQRGVAPVGPRDIGAFESRGFALTLTGTPQSALAGTTFARPLGVVVTANDPSEPVAGGRVTLSAPATGPTATLSAVSLTLDAAGTGSATATAAGGAGTYAVTASAAGTTAGSFALTNATFPQAITFELEIPTATFGDDPAPLPVSGGGSGNPVVIRVVSGPAAVVNGTLVITGAGTVVLEATQAGGGDFADAPPVRRTLTVAPAPLTVTASDATRVAGQANPTFTASFAGFVNGDTDAVVSGLTLTTAATAGSPAGAYTIVPSGATAANYTITFVPGALTVTAAPVPPAPVLPPAPLPPAPLPPAPPFPAFTVGAGAGTRPEVSLYNTDGTLARRFLAFEESFTGGVAVATGDLDGDGVRDFVAGAGAGGAPRVRAFSGATGATLADFFAFEDTFRGGVWVAIGDVDGDGRAEIVTGAGLGGGPRVRAFALDGSERANFFVADADGRVGVTVAAGDLDGDGRAEVLTGSGGTVRVYAGGSLIRSFDSGLPGPISVGLGGGRVVVGSGTGATASARTFAADGTRASAGQAFEAAFRGGTRVAAADLDGDGTSEMVLGAGTGGGPRVRVLDAGGDEAFNFFAFDPALRGGVFVG